MADRPDEHRLGGTPAHRQPSFEQQVRPACPWGLRSFGPSWGFSNSSFNCKVVGRKHDDHGHARSILVDNITDYGLLPFAWSRACCHSYGARSKARRKLNTPRFALALSRGAKWASRQNEQSNQRLCNDARAKNPRCIPVAFGCLARAPLCRAPRKQ
jgi:hypothetical protein